MTEEQRKIVDKLNSEDRLNEVHRKQVEGMKGFIPCGIAVCILLIIFIIYAHFNG